MICSWFIHQHHVYSCFSFFFFFNDTATTEIYTLSLHDALPISSQCRRARPRSRTCRSCAGKRSEEHTSELQSQSNLVCRLLLEKKKKKLITSLTKTNKKNNNKKIVTTVSI